ncbi:hypothetical protein Vi05172_g10169 [Venturia inaequalis]|nr:hypothetical protein Vi05172_g10169 [Venturia inaequalis]
MASIVSGSELQVLLQTPNIQNGTYQTQIERRLRPGNVVALENIISEELTPAFLSTLPSATS